MTSGKSDSVHPFVPLPEETVFIGARLCPKAQSIERAVGKLKPDIQSYRSGTEALTHPWFHNRYTFYTVWMFAFATGVRAINTPYVKPFEVSELNGSALLRDKDSDSGQKAKLIWIPEELKKQMDHYSLFIGDRPDQISTHDPCYFIDEEKAKRLPVRPKSLEPYLAEYLPGFPVGIHRRFMFNALLDSGCPPETVRVWMGHATVGDEPWSAFGSFSYARHRDLLFEHLVGVLKYLGFEAIPGDRP